MSPRWRALRVVASYAALTTAVGLAALPLRIAVEPANRPLVMRLAAALVLGIALAHIRSAVRRSLGAGAGPLRVRGRARPDGPTLARHFQEALDDLRFGRASHSYWTRVLRPRLAGLAGRLPGPALPVEEPPRSRLRRLLGLGPSLAALTDIVARLERQERP